MTVRPKTVLVRIYIYEKDEYGRNSTRDIFEIKSHSKQAGAAAAARKVAKEICCVEEKIAGWEIEYFPL